ncbi:Wzz/FepE/Etk N-terminal domain-containing protein [Virgibacillus sp. MG-45]|uniref:Wzz/FepE/Etk N-terminal domain-containing protein n=1 Tax=Virgibacillus sp. MG-45 TaxID=3102791 RepID=UPI002ED829E9
MNEMEETISLQEIIEKLWNGKWIIIGITLAFFVLSAIYSFVIADPVYKGTAKVTVHNVSAVPETIQPYINEMTKPEIFNQTMKSTVVIEKIIETEKLDSTVSQLQNSLTVQLPKDETSSLITVSMEGTDKEKIKSVIDSAVQITREQLGANIQSRLTVMENEYKTKMEEENEQLAQAVNEFNEINAGEGLPTLLLFQQNAASGNYMLEANEVLLEELKNLDKSDQVKYEKINKKINNLTSLYNFYSDKYDEVRSISTMNIVDISSNVLSEAFVPKNPIAPNKVLNVAMALVLGFMISVFVVFIKPYLELKKNK